MNTPASSNSFASTVDLSLRPSVRVLQAVFVLHLGILGLLPFSMQQGLPMLLVAAALALSWLSLRRHPVLGFGPRALTRLVWHADGRWTLHPAHGAALPAELLPGSLVHPWLLVLCFRLADGSQRQRLIAGSEAEAQEALQRLRARLSLG